MSEEVTHEENTIDEGQLTDTDASESEQQPATEHEADKSQNTANQEAAKWRKQYRAAEAELEELRKQRNTAQFDTARTELAESGFDYVLDVEPDLSAFPGISNGADLVFNPLAWAEAFPDGISEAFTEAGTIDKDKLRSMLAEVYEARPWLFYPRQRRSGPYVPTEGKTPTRSLGSSNALESTIGGAYRA